MRSSPRRNHYRPAREAGRDQGPGKQQVRESRTLRSAGHRRNKPTMADLVASAETLHRLGQTPAAAGERRHRLSPRGCANQSVPSRADAGSSHRSPQQGGVYVGYNDYLRSACNARTAPCRAEHSPCSDCGREWAPCRRTDGCNCVPMGCHGLGRGCRRTGDRLEYAPSRSLRTDRPSLCGASQVEEAPRSARRRTARSCL